MSPLGALGKFSTAGSLSDLEPPRPNNHHAKGIKGNNNNHHQAPFPLLSLATAFPSVSGVVVAESAGGGAVPSASGVVVAESPKGTLAGAAKAETAPILDLIISCPGIPVTKPKKACASALGVSL